MDAIDLTDRPSDAGRADGCSVAVIAEHSRVPRLERAVVDGGGTLAPPSTATSLVWTAWSDPVGLRRLLDDHPQIEWVQLSTAGVDAIAAAFDETHDWTCAKGSFSRPIAEHALALALAGRRQIHAFSRSTSFGTPAGQTLLGGRIVVVGGGGIATAFVDLVAPFDASITVVRRHPQPMPGVELVVGSDELDRVLPGADLVVLALPLTAATYHLIGPRQLELLSPTTWIVNVSRGAHIDGEALTRALGAGRLGGAALDVTEPEPLPAGHPLWSEPRCIITPHTACTPEMGDELFARRVHDNVERRIAGAPLLGRIDPHLGY